jgi:hypothetical protein
MVASAEQSACAIYMLDLVKAAARERRCAQNV